MSDCMKEVGIGMEIVMIPAANVEWSMKSSCKCLHKVLIDLGIPSTLLLFISPCSALSIPLSKALNNTSESWAFC